MNDKECNISTLLQAIQTVLTLPMNHSYKTTKKKLIEQIQNHVNEIHYAAFEQLQHDMKEHLKYGKKINMQDFNAYEMDMLEELSSNYDL